jgi:hypothetical protein
MDNVQKHNDSKFSYFLKINQKFCSLHVIHKIPKSKNQLVTGSRHTEGNIDVGKLLNHYINPTIVPKLC